MNKYKLLYLQLAYYTMRVVIIAKVVMNVVTN